MDFNIEISKFPSVLHSHIYAKGRGLMPLSRTLVGVQDPSLRESCIALHGFVTDMLSDMYDNPEAYHLPVMNLENFLGGRPMHVVKHESQKKLKDAYAQIGQAANTYIQLPWRLGNGGEMHGNGLIVPEESLQYVDRRVRSGTSPIKLEKRLEALGRVGFVMEALPTGGGRFVSNKYSNIFLALCALPWDFVEMLDFRFIGGDYKSTHDDYFYPLINEQRERAYALHAFATQYKMRLSTNANWGVVYHYKGKQVMCIGTGDDIARFLEVKVMGKDKKDAHTVIDKSLENEPKDLQEEARRRMTGCNANQCLFCSTYSSGWYETVLGQRHQICGAGLIGFAWREPAEADMGMIKRLVELRCVAIDQAKSAKKVE